MLDPTTIQLLVAAGIALIVFEMIVPSLNIFLFWGVGCILGSIIVFFVPSMSTETIALTVTSMTVIVASVFWKTLKDMQNKVTKDKKKSDLIGFKFTLSDTVGKDMSGIHKYSGLSWKVFSEDNKKIEKGMIVEVMNVEVGKFFVREHTEEKS